MLLRQKSNCVLPADAIQRAKEPQLTSSLRSIESLCENITSSCLLQKLCHWPQRHLLGRRRAPAMLTPCINVFSGTSCHWIIIVLVPRIYVCCLRSLSNGWTMYHIFGSRSHQGTTWNRILKAQNNFLPVIEIARVGSAFFFLYFWVVYSLYFYLFFPRLLN